jgi:Domain of unknown function (DUF1824)
MTTQTAEALLRGHEDLGEAATSEQRSIIRQLLETLSEASDYHIFGVCADNQPLGLTALQQYASHFGYDWTQTLNQPLSLVDGAVYLKYNPHTKRYFADSYTGTYRGVLISFQSVANGYSGTHGHFPLNLFQV